MRHLRFIGTVRANAGAELIIPGRDDLILKPENWPRQLGPVVNIDVTTFPDGFAEVGQGEGLATLNARKFRPALVIPRRKIIGSDLKPTSDNPTRGFAEVWRADIQVIGNHQETQCWAFWMIGSDATRNLQLVAQDDLRSGLKLNDGMEVKITIWEAEPNRSRPPEQFITDWCKAARSIEADHGREKAMGYVIGEKFLNFLERAETDRDWRQAIPAFVSEIKACFEPWQLAEYLDTQRRLGALGHASTEEGHRMLQEALSESEKAREDARNLLLLEWARELLVGEGDAR